MPFIWLALCLDFLIRSESLVFFKLSNMAFSQYCVSILFTQDRSCSPVIFLVSFMIVSSLIICAVIVWSLLPFMHCSSDNIVSLCCGLKLSLNILNSFFYSFVCILFDCCQSIYKLQSLPCQPIYYWYSFCDLCHSV